MDITEDTEPVEFKIVRVRTFIEFENPSLMKITEEITLFNDSDKRYSFITYELGHYRTALEIFDHDGKMLVFHGSRNVDSSAQIKHKYSNVIDIELPKGKPLREKEYRVIKTQYIVSNKQKNLQETDIDIHLYKNASIYTFIKECEGYEFTVDYLLSNSKGKKLDPSVLKTDITPFFSEMSYTLEKIPDGNVLITVKHEIPRSVENWAILGYIFGYASLFSIIFINFSDFLRYLFSPTNSSGSNISNYLALTSMNNTSDLLKYFSSPTNLNGSNVSSYLVLASMTISFLGIIKGWIFLKRMDKELKEYDKEYTKIIFFIIVVILIISLRLSIFLVLGIVLFLNNFISFVGSILYDLMNVFGLCVISSVLLVCLASLVPKL